jgi:hypothetical protein
LDYSLVASYLSRKLRRYSNITHYSLVSLVNLFKLGSAELTYRNNMKIQLPKNFLFGMGEPRRKLQDLSTSQMT